MIKKWSTVLLCQCSWFWAKNIDQRCISYKIWRRKNCSIESWFFSYEERYIYCLSKKAKINTCHRTTFDSVFNMSSNYKMIFLKSPKSSKFAICFDKQWSKIMSILSFSWFLKIDKLKKIKVASPVGSELAILGFEAKEQLRNMMRKENCRKWL